MNHADGTAPIYAQLIRERGDVPGDVRQTAEEVIRDLGRVIRLPAPTGAGAPAGHPGMGGPTGHPGMGGPTGQPGMSGPTGHAGIIAAHRSIQ